MTQTWQDSLGDRLDREHDTPVESWRERQDRIVREWESGHRRESDETCDECGSNLTWVGDDLICTW